MNFQHQLVNTTNPSNGNGYPFYQVNPPEFSQHPQQPVYPVDMSLTHVNAFNHHNMLAPISQSPYVVNHSVQSVQPINYAPGNSFDTGNTNRANVYRSPLCSTGSKKRKSRTDSQKHLEQEQAQTILRLQQELEAITKNTVPKTEYQKLEEKHARALEFNQLAFLGNKTLINTRSQLQKELQTSKENHKIESEILMAEVNKWKVKFEEENRRCETLLGENTKLEKEMGLKETEIRNLNLSVKNEKKLNKELSCAVHVLRDQKAKLDLSRKDAREAHKKELQEQNQMFTDKLTERDAEINTLRVENTSLETNLCTMRKQNAAFCKKGCICEKEISDQWSLIRRFEQEKSELTKELQCSKVELNTTQTKNKRLEERLKENVTDNQIDKDTQPGIDKI